MKTNIDRSETLLKCGAVVGFVGLFGMIISGILFGPGISAAFGMLMLGGFFLLALSMISLIFNL